MLLRLFRFRAMRSLARSMFRLRPAVALSAALFCLVLGTARLPAYAMPGWLQSPPPDLDRLGSEDSRLGPFQLRGASPVQLMRVSMTPLSAEVFSKGKFLLHTSATWNNRWAYKPNQYFIDGEFVHFSIAASYGITDWLQVRMEIPFGVRGGGGLDGLIMGFHEAFGYAPVGRPEFPVNRFRVILWRKDGSLYMLGPEDAGIGMEDMMITAKFRLIEGISWLPLTFLSLQMKIPTGSEAQLWGTGSLDGAVSLSLAKRLWRLYFYTDLQYTRFGSDSLVGIPMEQNAFSFLLSAEWAMVKRWSLLFQYLWHSGQAIDFYEFSKPTSEIALGVKGVIAKGTVLSFSLIENIYYYDNSPDIGFYLSLNHAF
jgi:hypothetical protein